MKPIVSSNVRDQSPKPGSKRKPAPAPAPAPTPTPTPLAGGPPVYAELLHFFNASADLLCLAGFDGRFKQLNPAWEPALGWPLAKLLARPFLDLVHPADQPATRAELATLAAGGRTALFDNRYQCRDGAWKWLQWTASPLPGGQGICAIARDVSRQKSLEKEILETLDGERERVGWELHDGLCQEMAGIAALSATLARKLAPAAAAESAAARELGQLLHQSIGHARDLARGFIPLHRKAIGLVPALADFCANTGALFKIRCRFQCELTHPKLDATQKSHLYRIVQEAVNNAIAHGRAKRIEVALAFAPGRGTLTIRDNGTGFGDRLEGHSGVGLRTMEYRARLIGATFEVKRRTLRGTLVTCHFSVPDHPTKP